MARITHATYGQGVAGDRCATRARLGRFRQSRGAHAWLPPGGMTGRFERFDARPGGSYRMVLTYPDASGAPGKATADSDIVEARFADIVPGERVVQAVDFVSDDPAYAGTMTMTWQVTA